MTSGSRLADWRRKLQVVGRAPSKGAGRRGPRSPPYASTPKASPATRAYHRAGCGYHRAAGIDAAPPKSCCRCSPEGRMAAQPWRRLRPMACIDQRAARRLEVDPLKPAAWVGCGALPEQRMEADNLLLGFKDKNEERRELLLFASVQERRDGLLEPMAGCGARGRR